MAAKRSASNADPIADAAIDYFAARSHDAWRRSLLKTNPEQKGKPRMRLREGVMVDVNQPWSKLHPKAKADNKRAAQDAYAALKRFPNDREAAAEEVHKRWIKRNKGDPNQPKELFKPYGQLPEVEKDKDRVHIDEMKRALAALGKRGVKKAPPKKGKAKRAAVRVSVEIDARTWRRLESVAQEFSAAVGRPVTADVLLAAGVEVMAAVSKLVAAGARPKKT